MKKSKTARAGRTAPPPCSAEILLDAARYRFLRDTHEPVPWRPDRRVFASVADWHHNLGGAVRGPWSQMELHGDALDKEVDRAMRKKPNK